jgi:hypothetical protein
MTNTPNTPNTTHQGHHEGNCGKVCPWDQINEPGAYVCQWSGHLLRVPDDGVTAGRSPMINIVGPDPLYVTKISNYPWISLTKARMLASNYDLNVNF